MEAGKLNTRLDVLGLPPTRDNWGHTAGQRPVLGKVWANVGRLSGKALIRANAVTTNVTVSIRVRYGAAKLYGLMEGMRLSTANQHYEVMVVLPDDAGREHVDLACKEVTPDA
ncbi:phage head closure protein [Bordetella bronchiseptica]|uniref:phage head closure protein n=1 Tax=Bordetella bronchiseptica TaxID=518 RepID=UPI00052859DB|nr:phage head closure protein [Bordetella bronchiseptica]